MSISLEPGWVCPLALIRRAPNFFAKIIFRSVTCHFFTKLWSLKHKVHFPFSE
jgi:hypothetical protein